MLEAIDADVIKTYVDVGLGIGIIAGVAYDPRRDANGLAEAAHEKQGSIPTVTRHQTVSIVGVARSLYYRDKKVVGVFVRFSCAASSSFVAFICR